MDSGSKANLALLGVVALVVIGMALTNNLSLPLTEELDSEEEGIGIPGTSAEPLGVGGDARTPVISRPSAPRESEPAEKADPNVSPWRDKVSIIRTAARGRDLLREYLTIRLSSRAEGSANITGWRIRSVPQHAVQVDDDEIEVPEPEIERIPQAATVLRTGIVGVPLADIILEPGQRAHIISGGPSYQDDPIPILWSFRVSKCSGYFARDFRLRPSLDTFRCPSPLDEFSTFELTNECYDFMRSLGRCEDPTQRRPNSFSRLPETCREQIEDHFTYNSCLRLHRTDEDFFGDEWYVFLNRNNEFYPDRRNIIQLFDRQGLLVDSVEY